MEAREQMWRRVYHKAREVYGDVPGYAENDARLTADAAASGWYVSSSWLGLSHRRRRLHGLARMPKPGNLLELGRFLELEWVMPEGEIRGLKIETPIWWSHSKQAIFILPHLERGPCTLPPRRTENALAQMWQKGRPAVCSSPIRVQPRPMPAVYPGIQISYSSDKFTHGRAIPYIHHFGPGVLCYFSHEPFGASRAPDIMIRGGRLRLTKHGIDG